LKKLLTGIAVAAAAMLLLPMTSANALLLDDAATSVAAVATGHVTLASTPDPTQPFDVQTVTGAFGGLVLAGAFTANTAKAPTGPASACAATVNATGGTTAGSITFTAQQDLLVGGGAINNTGVHVVGATPGVCSVDALFAGGGFVRAGVVAVAIFQLQNQTVTSPLGTAVGDTLGTFIGAAVPAASPDAGCGIGNPGCSEIAGPVVG
jgi:hypothetical protein